jgi:hypothetical protein
MRVCRAKQAADKQAKKDDAAFAAATSQHAGGTPVAAAASPAQPGQGADADGGPPSADAADAATATERAPDTPGSPGALDGRQREPSGKPEAPDEPPGDGAGNATAVVEAPAPPKPAVPVRHTDEATKAAARERYLARKKRKAEEPPEPHLSR